MSMGWARAVVGSFTLDIQWAVAPGQVLVLLGPSGSGKTLTLKCIAGLLKPVDGVMEIDGVVVFDRDHNVNLPTHHRRVGYVPQNWLMFPHIDLATNIGFGVPKHDRHFKAHRVQSLIDMLKLTGLEKRYSWELSGGQQQRVSLARALATNPSILLLDEPFASLDVEIRNQLRSDLRGILEESNIPVIFVTHDADEALIFGDTVAYVNNGYMRTQGASSRPISQISSQGVNNNFMFRNLLYLTVLEIIGDRGLMKCGNEMFSLEVPLKEVNVGENVAVEVSPDDVLLFSVQPSGVSATNVHHGYIDSIQRQGLYCYVTVACGANLISRVISKDLDSMRISLGDEIWTVVKTSSSDVTRFQRYST